MNRCAEAAAVAATVPGAGVGDAGLRPPMVPRQASFFPPPVPNPFVQQTRIGTAKRVQVRSRESARGRDAGLRMEGTWGSR
jgi:lysophosphatidylcholine acyltransferase/lyso-PAF acetyltransferase